MSKCISRHGEYSEHEIEDDGTRERFYCRLCWVLDEDALIDRLEASEGMVAAARALVDEWSDIDSFVNWKVTGLPRLTAALVERKKSA